MRFIASIVWLKLWIVSLVFSAVSGSLIMYIIVIMRLLLRVIRTGKVSERGGSGFCGNGAYNCDGSNGTNKGNGYAKISW